MQRSGAFFQKARDIVKSGDLGEITFCRTFQAASTSRKGYGNPPDSDPPPGLDWDLWLGGATARPFTAGDDEYKAFVADRNARGGRGGGNADNFGFYLPFNWRGVRKRRLISLDMFRQRW